MDHKTPPSLEPSASDHAAMALRSTLGGLPVIGAFVSELVQVVLPDLLAERERKFLIAIDRRVRSLEATGFHPRTLSAEQLALFQDGAQAALKATSEERIERISQIVANGLNGPAAAAEHQRYLLRLLGEMTDRECAELLSRANGSSVEPLREERVHRLSSIGVLKSGMIQSVDGYSISDVGLELAELLRN